MSDETPFWERDPSDIAREEGCDVPTAMYLQAGVERDHLRMRLNASLIAVELWMALAAYHDSRVEEIEEDRDHLRSLIQQAREAYENGVPFVDVMQTENAELREHLSNFAGRGAGAPSGGSLQRDGFYVTEEELERLEHERWRPVDGEETPPTGERIRVWAGVEVNIVWCTGRRSFDSFSRWAEFRGFTHWRPAAKGPGGEG